MAVDLEKINNVLVDPTTVNLHKNPQVESGIKVRNRTDLASSQDMSQNFIYANGESLEENPRFGKYNTYTNIKERTQVGSKDSGVQKYVKPLALKSLSISLGSTPSVSASDAYKISSSDPFTVTLVPTPNVTNLVCNIRLSVDSQYLKYFTIDKIDNFNFTVTPKYDLLKSDKGSLMPFSIRFIARDYDNPKIAYESNEVGVYGYLTVESSSNLSGSSTSGTQYVHIMYSATTDHRDMKPALSGASWMGILTDFNAIASDDPNDYTWNYIKGDPGSEGQAGSDGADGASEPSIPVEPSINVSVSSNVFPVGQDGWSIGNKDITYSVQSYNTNSRIFTKVAIDGSGVPYAYVSNWLDGFTMGKFGLDIWTLFENPNHQEFEEVYTSTPVSNDSIRSGQCITIPVGRFRQNASIKELQSFYARLGFYIDPTSSPNAIPYRVALIYGHNSTQGFAPLQGRVDIPDYQLGEFRQISTYANWTDSMPGTDSWMNQDMYIRFYFNTDTQIQAKIKISEYMVINMSEILPSGHSLSQYLANAYRTLASDIVSVMDLLPWFSGEYEAGVSIPWGIARRMFTNYIDVKVKGDLYIDKNYIYGLEIDGINYLMGSGNETIQGEDQIPGYNPSTQILTINRTNPTSIRIYYFIPVDSFEESWKFSEGLYCNTSDLPYVKYGIDLSGCIHVSGDTEDLPRVEKEINLSGCTGISGSVFNMPKVIKYMNIENCRSIGYDKDGNQESAEDLWWMKDSPNLNGSAVIGTYPY